jgi:hypothetical protein
LDVFAIAAPGAGSIHSDQERKHRRHVDLRDGTEAEEEWGGDQDDKCTADRWPS